MGDAGAGAGAITLARLLDGASIEVLSVAGDVSRRVESIALDSAAVGLHGLFFCVRGQRADGHRFAGAAIAAGASVLVCDRPLGGLVAAADLARVTVVYVNDVRAAMGPFASAFYGEPSRSIAVLGVTGTNGKTTTVHMIASVLNTCGRPARSIGTLTGSHTTPEAPSLQAQFADARDHRAQAVAVEVSSHALHQHRVDATRFAAVAFTNLTPDHLDFHGSMQEYFNAKKRLFTRAFSDTAVIDIEESYGQLLAAECGLPNVVRSGASTVEVLTSTPTESHVRWRGERMVVPIGGRFNVANAAVAADVVATLGIDRSAIAAAMALVPAVPGRFEHIDEGQPFAVVVDYAHTPDGLLRVLQAAREGAGGHRVIVVFGCGGDRDRAKRPLMGAHAEHHADVVIVTSDNPRGEPPQAIIDEIVSGMAAPPALIELDRRAAIRAALATARAGDVVVIAGKGHEPRQIVGDLSLPFDDRSVARELLRAGAPR